VALSCRVKGGGAGWKMEGVAAGGKWKWLLEPGQAKPNQTFGSGNKSRAFKVLRPH